MSSKISSSPAPEEDQIFLQDRKARDYDAARKEEGTPYRAFNLTTGTIMNEDGRPFRPLAILAADEDRRQEGDDDTDESDYIGQADKNNTFAAVCLDVLYGKKNRPAIAYAPTAGSSGAQMRLWHMLKNETNDYSKRKRLAKSSAVHMTVPSWPDHVPLAQRYRYDVKKIPYINENGDVDIDSIVSAMRDITKSIFLFQLNPHNPTGKSIHPAMPAIAEVAKEKKHTLVLDISFPGYGEGMESDMEPSKFLAEENITHFITTSISKIAGYSGKRAGLLGMVYGKSEGDTMQRDTHDLREMGRWTAGHPDSEPVDLISRVFANKVYTSLFFREQSQKRELWNEQTALLQEGLPELRKELEGMGPFRAVHSFGEKHIAAAEDLGVFFAPVQDIHGNTIARINIGRIGSIERIPELIEKMRIILKI